MRTWEDSFEMEPMSGCWLWTGPSHRQGYGYHKQMMAHRFSYSLYKGEIPKGLCVCHRCDNPSCVNPEHLFLGTHTDNMRDMAAKGRCNHPKGADHSHSKLTLDQVLQIRTKEKSIRAYAKEFNVCYATVREAQIGLNWKHVKPATLVPEGGPF